MGAKPTGGRNGQNQPNSSSGRPRPLRPAEASPQESYARLKATLDALPDLLFVLDREGRICDYHAPDPDRLYIPPEEFLGRKIVDVLPEPAAGVVRQAIADAMARGVHRGSVYPLPAPSGERWFEISIAAQGNPLTPEGRLVAIVRDVTERVRAEESLRESEEKYRLLTEGMKDVVWILDVETRRFTYCSPSVENLRGYTPEEILAQPLDAAWVPEERERLSALLQGYVADFLAGKIDENTFVPIEFLQPCKNGAASPSEAICRLLRNPRTDRLELHGITRDVSRRVHAENALRESEERFAQTARQSRAFVWEVDANGLYMFVTPVVEEVLGYRPDEIAGKLHFYDLHPEEGREEYTAAVLAAARQGREFRNLENPMVAKDGRIIWVSSNAFPLRGADGSLIGYRGSDMDVTARKQAENALRQSEARFAAAIQASRSFVWEVDPDGLFTHVDGMVAKVLGYRPEELVGRMHFYDLLIKDGLEDLKQACFGVMARRETISGFENANLAKDGRLVWLSSSARPLFKADGSFRGYQGIDTDVTARKQVEDALRESEARVRAVQDNLPDGFIYQMDSGPDGGHRRYTFLSQGVERLHGITAAQAMANADAIYKQILPEDLPPIAALEARAVATLKPFRTEVRVRLPNGEIRWRLFASAPRRLPNGHLVWDGVEIDVTERKAAEEALRESEARARAIHDNLPGGLVYQVDTGERGQQRVVTLMSKGAKQLHGVSAEEIMRDSSVFYRQFVAEDLPRVAELETQAIAAMRPFQAEARIRLPSGEIRWRLFASAPRRLPNGHLVWDGIEIDITERKLAEEALRRSEAKYRHLHETMRDAFATSDLQGRIQDFNAVFRDLTGYGDAELRGLSYRRLTPRKWHAREAEILRKQVLARGYSDVYEK